MFYDQEQAMADEFAKELLRLVRGCEICHLDNCETDDHYHELEGRYDR